MKDIFGDNIAFTDSSEREFGIPDRSFKSVKEAAEEAGMSRLYGGIHYKHSCVAGADEGKKLGYMINERLQMMKKESYPKASRLKEKSTSE